MSSTPRSAWPLTPARSRRPHRARGGPLVDERDQVAQDPCVGSDGDAMAEVEDVAGSTGGGPKDLTRTLGGGAPAGRHAGRVEVALDRPARSDHGEGAIEG